MAPIAVVPATRPTCWPLKWTAVESHVPTVTYHAPQMKYSRKSMTPSRALIRSFIPCLSRLCFDLSFDDLSSDDRIKFSLMCRVAPGGRGNVLSTRHRQPRCAASHR